MIKIILLCISHFLSFEEQSEHEIIWEETTSAPFQELTLFWHAKRPLSGRYTFLVSVRQNNFWSPWIYYGEWGYHGQLLFRDAPPSSFAIADEGKIKTSNSDVFRVRLISSGGASLQSIEALSVCYGDDPLLPSMEDLLPIFIESVPRQSLITLRHPRRLDLSLPVSMTILLNHFFGCKTIDPLEFAEKVMDDDNGFYENWSLNIAEASHRLHGKACLHFAHLPNFSALHALLLQGHPVIASLSGWIPGSPRPFRTEHALCVIGYDPGENKVICLDPMFPNDNATLVSYLLPDFLKGWAKHGNKAVYLSSGGVLLK
jgi:hypothetical protein